MRAGATTPGYSLQARSTCRGAGVHGCRVQLAGQVHLGGVQGCRVQARPGYRGEDVGDQ